MGFMKDCISEGWQSQGKWMSERPSHKGHERNNGVPTHKERTVTLLFATYYTLLPTVCAKR